VSVDIVIDPKNRPLILARLEPVVSLLHEGAEYATERSRSYFAEQSLAAARVRDKSAFAHLVRHQLKAYLIEHGQQAQLQPLWRQNSGVAFPLDWLDVLVLKSFYGRLPAPGRSRPKQAFYHQTIADSLWLPERRTYQRVNIVITWDVDVFGNLSVLHVYSPSGGGIAPDSAKSFWDQALAHPATSYQAAPDEYLDDADEEAEDLDISRHVERPAATQTEADTGTEDS
jgi:hypothetical protein